MARYENERWPRPDPQGDLNTRVPDDDSPAGAGGHGAGGGGRSGSGGTVVPRPERHSRPMGTPVPERRKFHHHTHGTGGGETDAGRGRTKTDNRGFGCVPKPKVPDTTRTLVIMEPEPLMSGKDPYFQPSYGRFALQKQLREEGIGYVDDAQSCTTSIADISRERAEELCRENGLKSFLFIEIGSGRDWFHSVHMTCSRSGRFRRLREYRLSGLEKDNIYERIESHLLMRFPDLSALGVDTERKAGKNQ